MNAKENEISELKKQNESLQSNSSDRESSLSNEITELKKQIESLSENVNTKENEISELKNQNESLNESIEQTKVERTSLSEQLSSSSARIQEQIATIVFYSFSYSLYCRANCKTQTRSFRRQTISSLPRFVRKKNPFMFLSTSLLICSRSRRKRIKRLPHREIIKISAKKSPSFSRKRVNSARAWVQLKKNWRRGRSERFEWWLVECRNRVWKNWSTNLRRFWRKTYSLKCFFTAESIQRPHFGSGGRKIAAAEPNRESERFSDHNERRAESPLRRNAWEGEDASREGASHHRARNDDQISAGQHRFRVRSVWAVEKPRRSSVRQGEPACRLSLCFLF